MINQFSIDEQLKYTQDELIERVSNVIKSGNYVLGEEVEKFEESFAEFCGAKYCVAVNSGTNALTLALKALQVGRRVLTTPMTFMATSESIVNVGAEPVYLNTSSEDANISVDVLRAYANSSDMSQVDCILPVHLYGKSCDMDAIVEIAEKHDLKVIEDCAQAHGATFNGQHVGTFGDIGCFSFYPSKILGSCGEGGAVIMNDKGLYEKCKALRNHGYDGENHIGFGFNFKMSSIQAACLNVKMKYLDKWVQSRRNIASSYYEGLKGISGVKLLFNEDDLSSHGFHQAVVLLEDEDVRNKVQRGMSDLGVGTRVYYPHSLLDFDFNSFALNYYDCGQENNSEIIAKQSLALPMYPELTNVEVEKVISSLKEMVRG